ncbi:MAG: hypothetical protein IKR70_08005 [Lachnospiraceae bacterium]|nr:hypothetical protein [Lachnospiraceae bacterium]
MMKKLVAKIIMLIIAIALLTVGLKTGGFKDVKNRAAMVCFECIGIG